MDSRRSVKYSRTSLQRTPTGPGPSVRWGGVRPFAGVHSTTLECSRAWSSPCKPKGRGVSLPQQNCLSVYHFHGHSQNLDSLYTQNEILAQSWLDPGFYRIQLYECKGKRLLQYVTLVYWSTPPPLPTVRLRVYNPNTQQKPDHDDLSWSLSWPSLGKGGTSKGKVTGQWVHFTKLLLTSSVVFYSLAFRSPPSSKSSDPDRDWTCFQHCFHWVTMAIKHDEWPV